MTKQCSLCKEQLRLALFHKNQTRCIQCAKTKRTSERFLCCAEGCVKVVGNKSYCCDTHKGMFYRPRPGWHKNEQGYIVLQAPNHINAISNGTVKEHIAVMSDSLGRRIETENGENVHHKNKLRDDNRIENLELWNTSQPAGARVEDLMDWAKGLMERYATAEDCVWMKNLMEKIGEGQ